MKKIDSYLIKNFIGPFVVAFGIGCFILIMQTMWQYVDLLISKGASLLFTTEIIMYAALQYFVMAIPIGVLLASVMVMGNLAEKYELSSFKSAGVSLLRLMSPLIIFSVLLSIFSYINSNFISPIATLKIRARIYDLNKQKPSLALEESVFNYDFEDFTIHIKDIAPNGQDLKEIKIYDQKSTNGNKLKLISAETGKLLPSPTGRYLILKLFNGTQFEEMERNLSSNRKYPFMRTQFEEYQLTFDMSVFDENKTNEDRFKHQDMLNAPQLLMAIDSLADKKKIKGIEISLKNVKNNLLLASRKAPLEEEVNLLKKTPPVSDTLKSEVDSSQQVLHQQKVDKSPIATNTSEKYIHQHHEKAKKDTSHFAATKKFILNQTLKDINEIHFVNTFDLIKRKNLVKKAKNACTNMANDLGHIIKSKEGFYSRERAHIFQFHSQFTFALINIVFLFIGASMGALVRKGGFGYPLLIAIIFFVLFIILNIFCKKYSRAGEGDPALMAWMPIIILAPLSIFLTYKAMNDSKIFEFSKVQQFFLQLKSKLIKEKQSI